MEQAAERTIPITVPLDLRRTLFPLQGVYAEDGWWKAARTPEGAVTLRITRRGAGVHAHAWGPGAAWTLERIPTWIGLDDTPEDLRTEDTVVRPLARRHLGYRFGATGLVFDALLIAIVEQKVAGKEARRSLAGLCRVYGGRAPGPRPLWLPPDPEALASATYWDLHRLGLERRRAETLVRVAAEQARVERLAAVDPVRAQAELRRFRGVGTWTAAETVAVSHGYPDAVSVGDWHHKNLVAWHLTGQARGTDERMLELLEPFRPHRGRVVRLLATAGFPPRFGPRMPLRDFAEH